MRYCPKCGTRVSADITICPTCGATVPQLDPSFSPSLAQEDDLDALTIHLHPLASLTDEQVMHLSGISPLPADALPTTPSPRTLPRSSRLESSPDIHAQLYTPPPTSSPLLSLPSRHSPQKIGQTIAILIVLLLVMLGSVSLIYYTAVARPNQLHAQATATVQAQRIADVHSTATVLTQATNTAVAENQATSTAIAQTTAIAQATVTAQQNLYTQITASAPALSSSLQGQDGTNWDEYNAVNGGGCAFKNNAYHASIDSKNYYVACFAQNSDFTNFAYQVDMTLLKGDEGGIIFRADNGKAKSYLLRIGTDGYFSLYISKDSSHSSSIDFDSSPAIKTAYNTKNTLTIIARGSNISFYINRQYIDTVNDNTYTQGRIGVFAASHNNATDVAFTNAKVWKI